MPRAVRFDRYGDAGVLAVVDVDHPRVGADDVLVCVRAAGINPGEAKIRSGALHEPAITESATGYQWRNAEGVVLLDLEFTTAGRYGWPGANTMHQPALEEQLAVRAAGLPDLTVLRGYEVVEFGERDSRGGAAEPTVPTAWCATGRRARHGPWVFL
jgi:hypothetical protein